MTILITKNKQLVSEYPKIGSTLQEKQSAFKFKAPSRPKLLVYDDIPEVDDKPNTAAKIATVATRIGIKSTTSKKDANNLLIGKPKSRLLDKNKSATPIPEMSTDKYEVVADSVPEFSEAAGNKFEEQIAMLQQAVDGTGELKDQMVNILTFLDDNPQYKDNVSPKDVAVFVAACRKVAGITVQEKVTRKTTKTTTTAEVAEVLDDLSDLSFEL